MLGQPDEGVFPPYFTQADLGVPGVGTPVIQGMVNPVDPNDADAMARGEELYLRYCVVCHGPDGVGTNAYIADKHPIAAGVRPLGQRSWPGTAIPTSTR